MRRKRVLKHEFVESIPDHIEKETLYISIRYATVVHKCCCGCGKEVVTPLGPTDWKLIFDGKTISLHPSIGNWSFECQSHYWITNNNVHWAARWSRNEIEAGRAYDRSEKERYFNIGEMAIEGAAEDTRVMSETDKGKTGFWQIVKQWWQRL
ncbi:hypothetical protein L0156_02250 [bacterium]|nr:hypothetical protein [bacterium]